MRQAHNTLIQLDGSGKQNWVSHVKSRCDYNAVDDEEHFLIHCSYVNEERDILFDEANNSIEYFNTMSSNSKFVMLITSQEHYIIKLLAKHVRICLVE